ncbi:hypothetical protein SDRG_03796 [Saprolegnia diclina VS20]|uniref:Uncharacterized protein n=1 Tax=Saprolegnia diclina (strain VS20) TaxID=1156394 RepID=T0S1E5_SAPDV|nr:hypothetical protein SDRG_03796 [Saprolegnia diclina VS20]EQC38838.1 hypothetical protein SDRG_03796 [Saprolegnia diclina VS20]|eukprot:XP_008607662.1 hypothetical protein SDRG_03796 [Saprolegnia diclina VS20]
MDVFSELRRHAGGNHAPKVKLNIVLAAITDVILERRGPANDAESISNTEYFAALMTALESTDATHTHEILQLLSMVLPEVHEAVLRTKFDAVAHCLVRVMHDAQANSDVASLKSGLVCLGLVLQALEPTPSVWSHPTVLKTFHVLLALATDPQPKIRKTAQISIVKILEVHADAHCDALSTHIASFAENILASAVAKDQTKVLQLVGFLASALPLLPSEVVTSLTEALFKLLGANQKTLSLVTLQALDALVSAPQSQVSAACLYGTLNTVLEMDANVHDKDVAICLIHITCRSVARLQPLHAAHAQELLPRVVVAMCTYFESQHVQVHRKTAECLNVALQATLDLSSAAPRVLFSLESLLNLRYQHAWSSIFVLLSSLVSFFGQGASPSFDGVFKTTVELYEAMDAMPQASDEMRKAFTRFMIASTIAVGAERMIAVVPLQNGAGIVEERTWLIPVVRDAVKQIPSRLEFFATHILNLAKNCEAVARSDSTTPLESKRMQARTMQLWSLFPSFCTKPTDLNQSFKKIAKTLANAMSDKRYPELQLLVCQGLQALIKAANRDDVATAAADQMALSKFAARFIPLLITIVEGLDVEVDSERLPTLTDTIGGYAKLAEPAFIQSVFKQLMQTLLETTTQYKRSDPKAPATLGLQAQAHFHMSIAMALIPIIDGSQVELLYRVVKPYLLDDTDPIMQKRSYSVLVQLCEHHPAFATSPDKLTDMIESLSESLLTCSVPAKKMRLRALNQIVSAMERTQHDDVSFIPGLVGEIMLCTKEANAKAREAAFELLLAMARLVESKHSTPGAGLMDFLQMVLGGLAARTPHMRSASVLCMSRLVFEFGRTEDAIRNAMPDLMRTVLMLLHEKAREVIKSVIGFMKLGIAILSKDALVEFLPSIIEGLLKWIGEAKQRFRAKTRTIMMKLCRKYGYEYIASLVPEGDKKLITHIRKTKEREDRQKDKKHDGHSGSKAQSFEEFMQDSDDEDSDREDAKPSAKASGKSAANLKVGKSYIKENAEDEIVDFLDNSAFKNIVNSRKTKKAHRDDEDFEFSKDGRLIIPGEPDADDDVAMESDDEDVVRRDVQKQLEQMGLSKKRKIEAVAGQEYKAKKAGGDIKKKGKLEPYAFIPLDPKLMAKRNKRTAVSRFEKVGKQKHKK